MKSSSVTLRNSKDLSLRFCNLQTYWADSWKIKCLAIDSHEVFLGKPWHYVSHVLVLYLRQSLTFLSKIAQRLLVLLFLACPVGETLTRKLIALCTVIQAFIIHTASQNPAVGRPVLFPRAVTSLAVESFLNGVCNSFCLFQPAFLSVP